MPQSVTIHPTWCTDMRDRPRRVNAPPPPTYSLDSTAENAAAASIGHVRL